MAITALIVIFALAGILFLAAAFRRLRRRSILGGVLHGATAVVLMTVSLCAALVATNLSTYQRLTVEQPAGELQFTRVGERQFNAALTYPHGERLTFALSGDEWQVDARVLKWHAFANMLGFDTAYRLDRIGGRYSRIEDERAETRSVYSLHPPQRIDLWEFAHQYHSWMPWMDALYGSATFLPMADGALYEINVSQSGLIARPLNQAARDALESWH